MNKQMLGKLASEFQISHSAAKALVHKGLLRPIVLRRNGQIIGYRWRISSKPAWVKAAG